MTGILDGKRILITGVITDASLAFHVARVAQEQGAQVVISNFGRALRITERIAGRLPQPAPVVDLDVTDPEHLERLPEALAGPAVAPIEERLSSSDPWTSANLSRARARRLLSDH